MGTAGSHDELMTTKEVAARLRVSEQTVHRMARSGELGAVRIRKRLRFRRSDVDALIAGERAS